MEADNRIFPWLDSIDQPAFCVKDGLIVATNASAEAILLRPNMNIQELLIANLQAYEALVNGTLYLTITVGEQPYNTCVTHCNEFDLFVVQETEEDIQLQALSLAAQQLRIPLSNMMSVTDTMFADFDQADSTLQQQASQINRNLFQMLRIIGNMADVKSYKNSNVIEKQNVNLSALFADIIEKIQTVSEKTQKKISYTGLDFAVIGMANEERIGRAVYNLLSNALKFAPDGSIIDTKLIKKGNNLSFTVCNATTAPVNDSTFWQRYHRKPIIENDRHGLGLGMTLISSVACTHGGTLLIDHPSASETRVTMTIPIVKSESTTVRSPVLKIGDYAGGWDKGLLELADILSADSFLNIN